MTYNSSLPTWNLTVGPTGDINSTVFTANETCTVELTVTDETGAVSAPANAQLEVW